LLYSPSPNGEQEYAGREGRLGAERGVLREWGHGASTNRKRHTPAQREKILTAYRGSPLRQREFCVQAGIGVSTLQLWLRKSARAPSPTSQFVEIPNLVAAPRATAVYRLHLRNGMIVEIGSGFQAGEVRALLRLLPA